MIKKILLNALEIPQPDPAFDEYPFHTAQLLFNILNFIKISSLCLAVAMLIIIIIKKRKTKKFPKLAIVVMVLSLIVFLGLFIYKIIVKMQIESEYIDYLKGI